jgi:hypothetical protein
MNKFSQVVRHGSYFFPADKRYGLNGTGVDCDRCHDADIVACVSFGDIDLCMVCMGKLAIKNEHGSNNSYKIQAEAQKTRMRQQMFTTAAATEEEEEEEGEPAAQKTRMRQQMFNTAALTRMRQQMFVAEDNQSAAATSVASAAPARTRMRQAMFEGPSPTQRALRNRSPSSSARKKA